MDSMCVQSEDAQTEQGSSEAHSLRRWIFDAERADHAREGKGRAVVGPEREALAQAPQGAPPVRLLPVLPAPPQLSPSPCALLRGGRGFPRLVRVVSRDDLR
eukprot:2739055-Rhodomonas_salina.2